MKPKTTSVIRFFAALLPTISGSISQAQNAAPPKVILEMKENAEKRLLPSSAQVIVARSAGAAAPGLIVSIAPGNEGYPGVSLKPEGEVWNLSAYGHVEAKIINTGAKPISVSLRVDNVGKWEDNPWNTESVFLKAGETGVVSTIFGFAYGKKPNYALDPAKVSNILLFASKSADPQSFRIETLQAAGPAGEKPPVDPNSIRVKPENGFLLSTPVKTSGKNVQHISGLENGKSFRRLLFPVAKGEQFITFMPAEGRWDLRDYLQVRLKLRNDGTAPVAPRARVESNGGPSEWISAPAMAPGTSGEIIVPFIGPTITNLGIKGTGNRVTNDAVSAVSLTVDNADAERSLLVESIKAELPPLVLPDWLGKRPPAEGDWVQTLKDEFDGDKLDDSIWQVHGPNYWDKQSHFSRDNVIIGGGVVRLRYEKKTGFHDDDPTKKQTEWQSGYLHSFDKWAQRYGYFESRMKLPKAPGLWPALWMMPDRGRDSKDRQDTGNGGMELDIMEHLTRWGANRYNIAMHYDGYGKDHKSVGTDKIYMQPDKDGFITAGLLWTPGLAVYYCNGVEVLRWEDPRISNVPEILMFTLPMGGWDNTPLDVKQLPDDFIIDYMRVWQRKDLASPTDGKKPPLPVK